MVKKDNGKICWNCKHITNIYPLDSHWCSLKEDSVKFDEAYDFFKEDN